MELNKEELIYEYFINLGELIRVESIDTIRDGGTKMIRTNKGIYYVNTMKDNKIYTEYSMNKEDMVIDKFLLAYLLDRIEKFVVNSEHSAKYDRILIEDLKKLYNF